MVRRPQVARCKSSPLRPRSTSPTSTCMEVRTFNATRPHSSKAWSDGSQADRSPRRPEMRNTGGTRAVPLPVPGSAPLSASIGMGPPTMVWSVVFRAQPSRSAMLLSLTRCCSCTY